MKQLRKTYIAVTLVFAIVFSAAACLGTWSRAYAQEATKEQAESNQNAPTGSSNFVTLYDVEEINSRPRTLEPVSIEVKAETWEMWGVMNWHKNLTYKDTRLGDIPLLEAYVDDGEEKPLLIFLHGLGDDKETEMSALSAFAEAGFHAVGVDAFDQGDRFSSAMICDTWAAVLITVADIDPVVEYFRGVENVDAENFVLGGFSMGAVEAVAYVETGSYKPAAVIALSGMCEYKAWQSWQRESIAYGWMSSTWDSVWTYPEWQEATYTKYKYDVILSMDVTSNLDSFKDIPILCCIGTEDDYFSYRNVRSVVQQIQNNGNENAKCIVYPFVWHKLTNRMLADSLKFLDSLDP